MKSLATGKVIPMVRMCLGILVCCTLAIETVGCSGQNIEGAWLGPLPFEDAKSCRIKIYSDHRFDVACGKMDWAGAGRYERDGDKLTLRFDALLHRGEARRKPSDLLLSFHGE